MRTPWVSFDGKNCGGCKHLNERGYCEFTACIIPCTVRATIPEVKPQTNADRIRSMTDEELADTLEAIGCPQDDALFPCAYPDGRDIELCQKCWLDWLKQEAEQ